MLFTRRRRHINAFKWCLFCFLDQNSNAIQTYPALLMHSTASAYKTNHIIFHAPYQLHLAVDHNMPHFPCTSTWTIHTPHYCPYCLFPNPPVHTTNKTQGIVGKITQDLGTVWNCCDVNPILFGWFLRVFVTRTSLLAWLKTQHFKVSKLAYIKTVEHLDWSYILWGVGGKDM